MRRLHRWILTACVGSLALGAAGTLLSHDAGAMEWSPGSAGASSLTTTQGVPVLLLEGDAASTGEAMGRLTAEPLRRLIGAIRLGQTFADGDRLARLRAAVPADTVAELTAAAQAAGVEPEALISANLVVDSHCSALAVPPMAGQPLRVARNMDFFPAKLLGPGTVLTVWRRPGRHAVAAAGWPGYAGVVSGMNDTGLSACILLQHGAPAETDGVPLAFRVRQVLETCATVNEAANALATVPPASRHYVLLADATTSAVVWREGSRQRRDDLGAAWLAAANGPRQEGRPQDRRGRCLDGLGATCRATGTAPTDDWMRRSLTASYMKGINAQAMLLTPATRTLDLSTGTGWHPAATNLWHRYDLAAALEGRGPVTVSTLGVVADPLPWGVGTE